MKASLESVYDSVSRNSKKSLLEGHFVMLMQLQIVVFLWSTTPWQSRALTSFLKLLKA